MLINYVGPQDPGDSSRQTLPRYQFENLVVPPLPPAKLFRNKIVLIIPYATVTKDLFETPFGTMYGGSAQANALNTILNRDPILPLGNNGNSLILLIVGLITTIAASRFGIWRSTAATVGVAAAFALIGFVWIDHFNVWMNVVTPEATVVLAFAGIMSLRFATEERQRRKLSKKFGLYVKPEIVDILMNAHEEEAALKPTRRPISILFVDVRGFTAMSEQMEPEDVVDALDVYLEELTASVQRFDGTVNKYVGDELVAVWNAPMSQENHAMLSVMCGLDMVSRMETINLKLRAMGRPAIAYGIGINSGDAVVGEMGSSFRVQYDVIGDTVNTGARLCSAAGRGEIIVGENTWQILGDRLVVEETEPLKLKGKSRPFRTFRLVDIIEAPDGVPEAVPAPV
jgi:adenylate cyclase